MQDQSLDRHLLTGHNFRIGAAEKGMEDSIIKTRGDGIVLPRIMPALTPQGCHSAVSIQPLQPVHKTSASIITFWLKFLYLMKQLKQKVVVLILS